MNPVAVSHIDLRQTRAGDVRAYLTGTRIRVQDIAVEHEFRGHSADEIVREYPQLTLGQVFAALSYYHDHRDEVLAQIRADEALADQMIAAHGPGPVTLKLRAKQAGGDSLSSG